MSKVTGNMQVQTPEGVAVTTTPATGTNGERWWWVADSNGKEDKYPEVDLVPLHPVPGDIDNIRYEVSARTLQVNAISPNNGSYSLRPETGVRIRHIPTGLIVEQTKDRAQFRNRDRALAILRERLAQLKQTETGQT